MYGNKYFTSWERWLQATQPKTGRSALRLADVRCSGNVGKKHISVHSYTPNCNHKAGWRPFKAITDESFTRGRCRHPPAFIKLKRAIQGYDQHVLKANKPTNPQASVPQHTRPPRTRLGQIPLAPTLHGNGQLYAWNPAVYPTINFMLGAPVVPPACTKIPLAPTLNGDNQLYAWSPAAYPARTKIPLAPILNGDNQS